MSSSDACRRAAPATPDPGPAIGGLSEDADAAPATVGLSKDDDAAPATYAPEGGLDAASATFPPSRRLAGVMKGQHVYPELALCPAGC